MNKYSNEDEYRVERRIAATIQRRFELTRMGMYRIRAGRVRQSPATQAYRDAIKAACVRSLATLIALRRG